MIKSEEIYIVLFSLFFFKFIFNRNDYLDDCVSLIIPSTESDFYKCYNQFFYFSSNYKVANEIILAISSVTNTSKIKDIVRHFKIKENIILGLRKNAHNAAANRNYGFLLSKCNIISFFDIDDIMSINRLSILYNLFKEDKTTEFVLHKYTSKCNTVMNRIKLPNILLYKYNLSYRYIYNRYKRNSKKDINNMRYCCKYIPEIKQEFIHNGWPTMRRYIMENIKYNESYWNGQDSDFNANIILYGYNISIINISLGYYVKDNKCINYKFCK